MLLKMVDERVPSPVAAAYRDLASGLRDLAATLPSPPEPDSAASASRTGRSAVVIELLRAGLRGATDVGLCSIVLATLLATGFNVWMAIAPPLRASI